MIEETDYLDKLHAFYNEQVEHARHHEVMRAEATNYILVASTGLAGLLSANAAFGVQWGPHARLVMSSLIVILNLYGMVLSLKHYERNRLHVLIARKYRSEISDRLARAGYTAPNFLREAGREAAKAKYPCLEMIRLHWLWVALHGLFVLIGGALFLT